MKHQISRKSIVSSAAHSACSKPRMHATASLEVRCPRRRQVGLEQPIRTTTCRLTFTRSRSPSEAAVQMLLSLVDMAIAILPL